MPRDLTGVVEIRRLGLDPKKVAEAELIYEGQGIRLYRVAEGDKTFVLKRLGAPGDDPEPRVYGLLSSPGVPTLPLFGRFDYGWFGMALRYSDCRNVVVSLGDGASHAFWEDYGPF